jgi:hypothetical protein
VVLSSVPDRLTPGARSPTMLHVPSIPTSLPRADLLVLRLPTSATPLRSLPVSPYPIYRDQDVLVHFFGSPDPPLPRLSRAEQDREPSTPGKAGEREQSPAIPWPQGMGWRRWVRGKMLGYRGDLWEEAEVSCSCLLPHREVKQLMHLARDGRLITLHTDIPSTFSGLIGWSYCRRTDWRDDRRDKRHEDG